MYISLDNISFYSQPPPAKSPPCAFPVSCWKPYETPLAPRAPSHAPRLRLPSPGRTITLASDARPDVSPGFLAPVREDPELRSVLNEFDIEIERIAMAQNGQVAHESDLDMHHDSGLLNGTVADVPQSQRTSLAIDRRPSLETASDSDPAVIPAESDLRPSGPPITSTDRLGLPRDSTPSLGTYDETDGNPTSSEVRFTCACFSPHHRRQIFWKSAPPGGV